MVFNQNPRKPIMFIANSSKNEQVYYQASNDSICCNLSLHRHNEDNFPYPQTLK